MARVPVSASGFGGGLARVNLITDIVVSVADIARATYFLGATSLRKIGRPTRWQREAAALHVASVLAIDRGMLVASSHYHARLSDEKRMASFYVGMAMAKLFAEKVLSAPYCITVEKGVLHRAITVVGGTSKSLPDIAATNGSQSLWDLLEAKGRLNATGATASEAKKQARRVKTVNKVRPRTKCGCAASLRRVEMFVVDPVDGGSVELLIGRQAFFEEIYGWFLRASLPTTLIEMKGVAGKVVVIGAPGGGVTCGLHQSVYEWARGGYGGAPPPVEGFSEGLHSVGTDGWALMLAATDAVGHV